MILNGAHAILFISSLDEANSASGLIMGCKMLDFVVSPVTGSYRERFVYCGPSDPLYCQYTVCFTDGSERLFSITKLSSRVYSLVDFGDVRQKDKHYTTFDRAYSGILAICRRVCKKAA